LRAKDELLFFQLIFPPLLRSTQRKNYRKYASLSPVTFLTYIPHRDFYPPRVDRNCALWTLRGTSPSFRDEKTKVTPPVRTALSQESSFSLKVLRPAKFPPLRSQDTTQFKMVNDPSSSVLPSDLDHIYLFSLGLYLFPVSIPFPFFLLQPEEQQAFPPVSPHPWL